MKKKENKSERDTNEPATLSVREVSEMTLDAFDAKALTWDTLTTSNYTWDQFEKLT